MIDLWYLNTNRISAEDMNFRLKLLPSEIINEILRFRNHEDQCFKLFGKLMVRKYYEDTGLRFNWCEWQVTPAGKPYYNNGSKKFSISHSGNYVSVAFSDQEIGTDIEKLTNFDIMSAINYLHPSETECIQNFSNQKDVFFKIWTRKEAYLKAIGKGIIDGLNNENCLSDELINNGKWYLHSLSLVTNYQVAICTQIQNCKINTREIFPVEFYV